MNKIGPYFRPHKSTCGAGVPAGGSVELPAYPYPIFMAYASQPADLVYDLTKAMIVNYDAYKDAAPGAAGLELKRQNLAWVVPYHEGAVHALKEAGAWKAEHEAHNQALVKRQEALTGGLDHVPEEQSARRQGCLRQGLDGGSQDGLDCGGNGSGVRIVDRAAAACRDGERWRPRPSGSGARISGEPVCCCTYRWLGCRRDRPARNRNASYSPSACRAQRPGRRRGYPRPQAHRPLALAADHGDGGDHLPVHQPAVHAALLRRLHAAQHRILLPADPVHAALHVPHVPGGRKAPLDRVPWYDAAAVRTDHRQLRAT